MNGPMENVSEKSVGNADATFVLPGSKTALLAVGGGLGGGIEALHSAAAWGQGARHMPARDSSMCHGCTHHNHAQQ
ncbi:hypothetical protein GmHk_03G006577 [Glycine max]|nr:hypothetical protein GmHk_03G006577 [Glycine max]